MTKRSNRLLAVPLSAVLPAAPETLTRLTSRFHSPPPRGRSAAEPFIYAGRSRSGIDQAGLQQDVFPVIYRVLPPLCRL